MTIETFYNNINLLMEFTPLHIYLILLSVLLMCGFGLPIPEDITLIVGGYLVYEGYLNLYIMMAVGMTGVLVGDSIIFMLGSRYGNSIIKSKWLKDILTPLKIKKASAYVNKYGNNIFFIARFLPGLRSPIYFIGGSLKAKFKVFFTYDFIATIISVPVWVYAANWGGEYIDKVIKYGNRAGMTAMIIITSLIILYALYKHRKKIFYFKKDD